MSKNMNAKRLILALVVVGLAGIFMTSIFYRMNNPSMVKHVQKPSGMGKGKAGGMSGMGNLKELMDKLKASPNDPTVLTELGNAFLIMGAWDRALEHLVKADKIKPDNIVVLKGIGISHFQKKDYDSAIKTFDRILKLDPNDGLVQYNLGIVYKYFKKDKKLAKKYFDMVVNGKSKDMQLKAEAKKELSDLN